MSLNIKKTKYSFFHKPSKKDNIPLVLPKLSINKHEIDRVESIKFLGVFIDENLTWKEHIKYTENKIAKNIGLLFRAKHYLHRKSLLLLYFAYIHSYINYANIAWGSTHVSNLQKIYRQQKHAIRIIYNKKKFDPARKLLSSNNILNVYQLNILNVSVFMHRVKQKTAPLVFHPRFTKPSHKYSTRFSGLNYKKPKCTLNRSKYRISVRGPLIWNSFLANKEKNIELTSIFKAVVKTKVLALADESPYF